MTREETRQLVRFVAALDGRKVTNDTVEAFHQMLAGYTYADAKAAAKTAIRNTSRDYCTIAEILQVANGQTPSDGAPRIPECVHGMPRNVACHDCNHDPGCAMCEPIPGLSDTPENRRSAVADLAQKLTRKV